jgi:hypothetical protein
MLRKVLAMTTLLIAFAGVGAHAQVYYSTPGYTYAAPVYSAPVVVYNTPPPVVYTQPAYVQPAPVYVEPAYYPGYYGYPGISLGFGYFGGGRHWH